AGAVGKLPAHRTAGRNERGDRAIGGDLHRALWTRQHAPPRARRCRAAEAADLLGLEELEMSDVKELRVSFDLLRRTAGDAEVVRLLLVRRVARRDVAADDDRQAACGDAGAERCRVDALL